MQRTLISIFTLYTRSMGEMGDFMALTLFCDQILAACRTLTLTLLPVLNLVYMDKVSLLIYRIEQRIPFCCHNSGLNQIGHVIQPRALTLAKELGGGQGSLGEEGAVVSLVL